MDDLVVGMTGEELLPQILEDLVLRDTMYRPSPSGILHILLSGAIGIHF